MINPYEKKELVEKIINENSIPRFEDEKLPKMLNVTCNEYWYFNAFVTLSCLVGRHYAAKYRAPRVIFSATAISLPIFAIYDRQKMFSLDYQKIHRHTLEERLELSPMTRRAYNKALEINKQKQIELKEEIEYYKNILNKS